MNVKNTPLRKLTRLIAPLVLMLSIAGCGGGGGSSAATVPPQKQMGGALQGRDLSLSNAVTTFAGATWGTNGVGQAATFHAPSGIAFDANNLYVVDQVGQTIRKIDTTTGATTTLVGSGVAGDVDAVGTAASFRNPQGVVSDGTNLYVADTNNHVIRKVVLATGAVSTFAGTKGVAGAVDATGTAASFKYPTSLIIVGASLYVADSYNHKIRRIEIASGAVTTLAGTGSAGASDGLGSAATFSQPNGLASDGTNLYVTDSANHRVRQIVIASGTVTTLAGSTAGWLDGAGAAARFFVPSGIVRVGADLYVTDTFNGMIRKIVIATGVVTSFAGNARGNSDGVGAAARFNYPRGITTDGTNLYVSDEVNHSIRKIVIGSATVSTIGGSTKLDGTGVAARFGAPFGVTADGSNLYVSDEANHVIRKIVVATGEVSTLAGVPGQSGRDNGIASAASFSLPGGVTTDGTNLFVADTENNLIRKIVISTGEVTTLAGSGLAGWADGVGSLAVFNSPRGITTDGTNLYVTEVGSSLGGGGHTVRKIVIASGVVSTLAGTPGTAGSADGIGAAAQFNIPIDITTDGSNLYVADSGNHTIRKIVIATGAVSTLAGSAGLSGSADGSGAAARFFWPAGITCDGFNLYVSDGANMTIRKLVIASGVVSTLAGSVGISGSADGAGSVATFARPQGITTDGSSLYVMDHQSATVRKIQ